MTTLLVPLVLIVWALGLPERGLSQAGSSQGMGKNIFEMRGILIEKRSEYLGSFIYWLLLGQQFSMIEMEGQIVVILQQHIAMSLSFRQSIALPKKVPLKPLKMQIDFKIQTILTYLTQKNLTQEEGAQCNISYQENCASTHKTSLSSSYKVPISEFLSQRKTIECEMESGPEMKKILPLKDKIMRLNSQNSNDSEESLHKKNIEEGTYSRIFCQEDSEEPQPFSLNINLDNIINRPCVSSVKSTERSNKKPKRSNKQNNYESPHASNSKMDASNSKKSYQHRTPLGSAANYICEHGLEGRTRYQRVGYEVYLKMQVEVENALKKARKEANENNVRTMMLKRIEKQYVSSTVRPALA